jgi:hypothetical protein
MDGSWDWIYNASNVNEMFNNCQFTILRFFDTSFLVTYIDHKLNDTNWITKGIRIFCGKKRELYSIYIYRNNKGNTLIEDHYKNSVHY